MVSPAPTPNTINGTNSHGQGVNWIIIISVITTVVLITCIVITICYCKERDRRKELEGSRYRIATKSGRFPGKSKSNSVLVNWASTKKRRNNRIDTGQSNFRVDYGMRSLTWDSPDFHTLERKSGAKISNWSSSHSNGREVEMSAPVSELISNGSSEKLPDLLRIEKVEKKISMPTKLKRKNEIEFKELVFEGEIAQGSFGSVVHKGEWKHIPVAIKLSNNLWDKMTNKEKSTFMQETKLSIKCSNHKNIVRVYGYTVKPKVSVVMEFCEYGSADKIKNIMTLSFEQKLNILVGSLKGLSFLHDLNIIHRDLAARNILLDNNLEAKICDFGMSRMTSSRHITNVSFGPVKWMSPESILEQETSKESDVYAWGITAWEILLDMEPYPGISTIQVMLNVVKKPNYRPSLDGIPRDLHDLLSRCWHHQPENRPRSKDALEDLKFIRRKLFKIPVSPKDPLKVLTLGASGYSTHVSPVTNQTGLKRNFSRATWSHQCSCSCGNCKCIESKFGRSPMYMPATSGNGNHMYSKAPVLLNSMDKEDIPNKRTTWI